MKLKLALLSIATCLIVTSSAFAASNSFCKVVLDVRNNGLFIYKNSAPVRSGPAHSSPIVGFRTEPTLIMNRVFSRSSITIYDVAGKKIGSCPWATADGHAGGRARCTMQTAALRRQAVKNTKSPTVLFKVSSTTCVSVPDAGRCYGSVKGLCNKVLK